MTPNDIKALRRGMGLSQRQFGLALGYSGANIAHTIRKYEDGVRDMPPLLAFAIQALADGYRPENWPTPQKA